tara:strand:+ start:253 stop:609 length:357 start_codon:yes stop_codon:yes gene_type:complete
MSKNSGNENIDRILVADSLDRIAQASYGDVTMGLYKTLDTEGQQKFIKRYMFGMLANKDTWKLMDNNLRKEIVQNPAFADTLNEIQKAEFIQEMVQLNKPNIMQRGANWIKRKVKSYF